MNCIHLHRSCYIDFLKCGTWVLTREWALVRDTAVVHRQCSYNLELTVLKDVKNHAMKVRNFGKVFDLVKLNNFTYTSLTICVHCICTAEGGMLEVWTEITLKFPQRSC